MRLVCILILTLLWVSVSSADITILVNKGPFASIEQGAVAEDQTNFLDADLTDDRACTECFAATELAKFIPKAIDIKKENIKLDASMKMPATGDVFILGSRKTNPLIESLKQTKNVKLENDQSYRICSYKDNGRVITIIEGCDREGTLYGVYEYLNRLGINFIGLGERGMVFPTRKTSLPSNLEIVENPSYFTRGFWSWYDREPDKIFLIWMARNKLNFWTTENQPARYLKKLAFKLTGGGHDIHKNYFNPVSEYPFNHPLYQGDEDKPDDPYDVGDEYQGDADNDGMLSYYEAHKEWFGFKFGKRTTYVRDWQGSSYCISNSDAGKEFARRLIEQFVSGDWQYVDVLNFWMLDGDYKQWCACEKCKALGSHTDQIFIAANEVLKQLKQARDAGKINHRVEISVIAYAATIEPPTKPLPQGYDLENSSITFYPICRCYAHNMGDASCTGTNQKYVNQLKGWTQGKGRYYKGTLFIGEYYNVSSIMTMPVVYMKSMSADIPWYYNVGARDFQYMHTPTKLWGTWTVNQHLMAKLLWNVKADATKILNDYFNNYYPTTSSSTRKFYEALEFASASIKALKHSTLDFSLRGRFLKKSTKLFNSGHLQYYETHPMLNDGPDVVEIIQAVELAQRHIDQSLLDCSDPTEQQRLLEDWERFDYGKKMYYFLYHMIRLEMFHRADDIVMAKHEFKLLDNYKRQLEQIVEYVDVFCEYKDAYNGFGATQCVKQFEEFKKLYGHE